LQDSVLTWLQRPADWPRDAQTAVAIAVGLCLILAVSLVRSRRYNRLAGEAFLVVSAELEQARANYAGVTRRQEARPTIGAGLSLPAYDEPAASHAPSVSVGSDAALPQPTSTAETERPHASNERMFGT
jgi:hypothetical protein